MGSHVHIAGPPPGPRAQRVATPPPPAHVGIGAALRETFGTAPLPEDIARLLRRLP